jgi:hypothetical protein
MRKSTSSCCPTRAEREPEALVDQRDLVLSEQAPHHVVAVLVGDGEHQAVVGVAGEQPVAGTDDGIVAGERREAVLALELGRVQAVLEHVGLAQHVVVVRAHVQARFGSEGALPLAEQVSTAQIRVVVVDRVGDRGERDGEPLRVGPAVVELALYAQLVLALGPVRAEVRAVELEPVVRLVP